MNATISLDSSGRLVLPKPLREKMNLHTGSRLRAEIVADRLELTPLPGDDGVVLKQRSGILVVARTGRKVDAASAVRAIRDEMEERGLKR